MKRTAAVLAILAGLGLYALHAIGAASLTLDIPPIAQSLTVRNLCGPTCAEMILRFYGMDLSQYDVGEAICAMVPEYQHQHPTYGALDCEWPDHYRETYQPILALYFEGLGFKTVTTRSSFDEQTGRVPDQRFNEFLAYLKDGIPVIFHVQGHYMLAVGYDDLKSTLYYNNPADGQRHEVSYSDFKNRYTRWYSTNRDSWDGRYLAVWMQERTEPSQGPIPPPDEARR